MFLKGNKLLLKYGYRHPKARAKNYHIGLSEGITGFVAKTGKPVIVNDTLKDNRYIAVRKDIMSELAVPIKTDDKKIGVLNVESTKLNAFDENDLFLISAIADQASIAIQNASINKS